MSEWNAHFSYAAPALGHKNYTLYRIPVSHFSVRGGTKRLMFLTSEEDLSMVSEFYQAIKLKNLNLVLTVGLNFEWVYDLLEIAARGLPLSFEFFVDGKQGKSLTHAFRLVEKNARIEQPQETTQATGQADTRLLAIRLALADPKLFHGSNSGGKFVEEEW